MILRAELKPGEALSEADLMQRIGIGRTPLRDALHFLAHEGLVDIMPRRGTFVSQVTVHDLQQIFEFRSGIEDIVAHAAASRVRKSHLDELRTIIERATDRSGNESDVALDSNFHGLLLRIVDNRYLTEMYRRLADASLRLLYLTGCGMETPDEQIQFFTDAEQALHDRNGQALARLLREHVRAFRDRVSRSVFAATARFDD